VRCGPGGGGSAPLPCLAAAEQAEALKTLADSAMARLVDAEAERERLRIRLTETEAAREQAQAEATTSVPEITHLIARIQEWRDGHGKPGRGPAAAQSGMAGE
jgi:hypothetical protein